MKAMNLYLLSRAAGGDRFSKLAGELTGSVYEKQYSIHEAESLRSLTDGIASVLKCRAEEGGGKLDQSSGRVLFLLYDRAHKQGIRSSQDLRRRRSCPEY